MFKSIRFRALLITVLFCTSIVITIRLIQILYTRAIVRSSFDEQIRTRLIALSSIPQLLQSVNTSGTSAPGESGSSTQPGGELFQEFLSCKILTYSFELFWGIRGANGDISKGQQIPGTIPPEAFDNSSNSFWWEGAIGNGVYRINRRIMPSGDTLFVGGSITALNSPLNYFIFINFIFGLILVTIITLGIWLILGLIFKPLTKISKIAENISMGKLSSRFVISEIDNELKQVGQSLNAMLDRLEQTIEAHAHYNSEVSHELLSPLNRITSILNDAADSRDIGNELRQKLLDCQAAVKKTTTLASDLLELARSESASTHTHVWIDLEPVIDEAIGEVEPLAREKEIQILLTSSTVGVLANPIQIHQVALNLLNNAIKFAPNKSTVYVSIQKINNQAQFGVADSGPGVPPEAEGRLFQRYFRKYGNGPHAISGNGLGLAICKNILTQHHGTICYKRTAEGLTLFEVLFPPNQKPEISL